jgi:hypothetical protein
MTALSLLVPLFALAFAFWFLGDEAEYSLWRLPFAGIFVGLTSEYALVDISLHLVGLMHYSAAFRLPYLTAQYTVCLLRPSLITKHFILSPTLLARLPPPSHDLAYPIPSPPSRTCIYPGLPP